MAKPPNGQMIPHEFEDSSDSPERSKQQSPVTEAVLTFSSAFLMEMEMNVDVQNSCFRIIMRDDSH